MDAASNRQLLGGVVEEEGWLPMIPMDRFEKVADSLMRLGGEKSSGTNPFQILDQVINNRHP